MAETTAAEVMAELAALDDPRIRAVNERHGDDHGVNLTKLRALAKRLRTRHELAHELWTTDDTAARLLALLICRPRASERDKLDTMLREARTPKVHDWLVNYVVKKNPHREELRLAWFADPDPVTAGAARSAQPVQRDGQAGRDLLAAGRELHLKSRGPRSGGKGRAEPRCAVLFVGTAEQREDHRLRRHGHGARAGGVRVGDRAQHGRDPGLDHLGTGGLDDVVVGTGLQADHHVEVVTPRGQHDDRQPAPLADPPADLHPVHAGQHQVEEHQIGPEFGQRGETGLTGRGHPYLVSTAAQPEVDLDRHRLTLVRDGETVRSIPVSGGTPGGDKRSWRGTAVLMAKEGTINMNSETVGLGDAYDKMVDYSMRLTWSGMYAHAAPWSAPHFGKANRSSGCIGMSDADAAWFYGQVRPGDPFEITGEETKGVVDPGNGFGAWNVPWTAWRQKSALR